MTPPLKPLQPAPMQMTGAQPIYDPDPAVRAQKAARYRTLREANPTMPRDRIISIVEREFTPRNDAPAELPDLVKFGLTATNALNPFQDEAAGALDAMMTLAQPGGVLRIRDIGNIYRETRDAAREPVRQFTEQNPKTALATNLVGGALSPINRVGGPATAATRLGRAAQTAVKAGVQGAVTGFGSAEGNVLEQGKQAAVGGVAGALIAGPLGFLLDPARGASGAANDLIARQMSTGGDDAVAALERAAARSQANPSMTGREVLARPGQQLAMQAAEEGGEGGRRIVAQAEAQVRQSPKTFLQRASRLLGQRGGAALEQTLDDTQRAATEPLYRALAQRPVDVTEEMAAILDDPVIERAYEAGRLAANSGVVDYDPITQAVTKTNYPPLRDANGNLSTRLPLGALNLLKRTLDGIASKGDDATTAITQQQAQSASSALDPLRQMLDRQVPEYAVARATAGRFLQEKAAMQVGRDLASMSDEEAAQAIQRLQQQATETAAAGGGTPEILTYAKAGVLEALYRAAEKGDPQRALGTVAVGLQRLRPILTPDEATRFEQIVRQTTRQLNQARRVASAGNAKAPAGQTGRAERAGVEVSLGLLRSAVRDMLTALSRQPQMAPDVRVMVANTLLGTGPDLQQMLQGVIQQIGRRQATSQTARAAGAAASAVATDATRTRRGSRPD